MALMKIVPLIDDAANREQASRQVAIRDAMTLLEGHFGAIRYDLQALKNHHSEITHTAVAQQRASRALYQLIHELQQRVDRLEAGGTPELNG